MSHKFKVGDRVRVISQASHSKTHRNYQHPNFIKDGRLYLIRCYNCNPKYGRENYGPVVASGNCAWCGWTGGESYPKTEEGDEFTEVKDE